MLRSGDENATKLSPGDRFVTFAGCNAPLRDLAGGLAELHRDGQPTVVVGVESRGALLG